MPMGFIDSIHGMCASDPIGLDYSQKLGRITASEGLYMLGFMLALMPGSETLSFDHTQTSYPRPNNFPNFLAQHVLKTRGKKFRLCYIPELETKSRL